MNLIVLLLRWFSLDTGFTVTSDKKNTISQIFNIFGILISNKDIFNS
jgi:hypothetical protein